MASLRLLIIVTLVSIVAGRSLRRRHKRDRGAHRRRGENPSGAYADMKHQEHLRHVYVNRTTGIIKSTDDGTTVWEAPIRAVKADYLVADFSSKGGPEALTGKLTDEGIEWRDGSTWTLMSAKASRGITSERCKTMCQRWGMKALGRAFDGIKMPQLCVPKCDEVYPEEVTPVAEQEADQEPAEAPQTL
jgi:hypothetical protein